MWFVHIMRESCVKSPMETFFMAGTLGVIARRTGPLNLQYPTCFIEEWRYKAEPWSVINLEPLPSRVIICEAYTVAQVNSDWSWMGNISAYFEKWPTNVNRYLFFLGVRGYGSVMSIEVISNGATGLPMSPRGAMYSRFPFCRWHELHSLA